MGECCSSNNGSNEGDLGKPMGRQSSRTKMNSKKGANAAFLNANIEQAIEETSANQELWTDVDKINDTEDVEEEDTIDDKEITFERKGQAHNLFKPDFMKKLEKEFPANAKKIYKSLGQYKYNKKDWNELGLSKNNLVFAGQFLKKGDTYIGEIRKGSETNESPIQEGRGVLISGEGAVYEGFWKDGLQKGKGRIIYDDKSVYQGEFQNGVPEGFGIYSTFNGSGIKGFFQNGKIEGKGIEVWQDGSIYRGDFVNGRKEGEGRFEWKDGSTYEGEVKDNEINGEGVYMWKDGRKYEGGFESNKMHGEGVYTWADGKVYKGAYVQDKKEGYGEHTWPDGRIYKGNWHDGKMHGYGEYINSKGERYEGEWENGAMMHK